MELQFEKTPLKYLHTPLRQVQAQEQTQEVRLPEGMPDVGSVIGGWGQVLVRGKEWRSGGIQISGGVMVWVLYTPEDSTQTCTLEAWLPFQMKWEFPESQPDGTILAFPLLQNVDVRSTSARKLMVRTGVSMLAEAMCQQQADIYKPESLPEDVCLLKNNYPVLLPLEAGEKAFSLEENLPLPETVPAPVKLLRYELRPQVAEKKLLGDKLIFRGEASLHILYCDSEQQIHTWDVQVPFSQYGELEGEFSHEAKANICMAVSNLELDLSEGAMVLKAGLIGQYTILDGCEISLVEDAYSPTRQVTAVCEMLRIPALLDSREIQLNPACNIEEGRILDSAFYPDHARVFRDEDGLTTELSGTFQVLYRDMDGQLHTQTDSWQDGITLPADASVKAQAKVTFAGPEEISGDHITATLDVALECMTQTGIPMVTALELGQACEPDPDRPSLILCRIGSQRLWDIAKMTGSTVEGIRKANGLQQEPVEDTLLLVPVP